MRSLKLSGLIRRNPDRPSLKQRAAALRASAAKVLRKKPAGDPDARDPARAAIEAHRVAYAEWDRLARAYNELPPGSVEFIAAYAQAEEPGRRETAAFEALLSTKATTVDGLRLLIEYLPTATRQVTIDNGDSDEQRALDLIRASFLGLESAQRLVSEPRHVVKLPPVSDLIVNAIRKEWAAYVELPDDATDEEFDRAAARRAKLFDAAERLPATEGSLLAKGLALAWIEYVDLWTRDQPRAAYTTDGRLALDIHAIVTGGAPVEAAPVAPAATLAFSDLSDATIAQLDTLHEHVRAIWLLMTAETQAPWCWDAERHNYSAVGRFLNDEGERWAGFLDVIAAKAGLRTPAGEVERDRHLEVRLRQEMLGNGRIADRALLAEINAAWGA